MNSVIKTSLLTSLLLLSFQMTQAQDSGQTSALPQDAKQQSKNEAQYILPPPSPLFSSNITNTRVIKNIEEKQLAALNTSKSLPNEVNSAEQNPNSDDTLNRRIKELELVLEKSQVQAANLEDELHATARNSDFENEMYEKTVALLQEKLDQLGENSKTLSSKLATAESEAGSQQSLLSTHKQETAELSELKSSYQQRNEEVSALKKQIEYFEVLRKQGSATDDKIQSSLSTLKQESAEFSELKNSYQQRKEEVSSLKKQIEYFEELRIQSSATDVKIQTLEDAYTAKSNEAEELLAKVSNFENTSKTLQEQVDKQNTQIATLNEKVSAEEQTQAELNDLQSETTELNENNQLLQTKIVELDNTNKSLKAQLEKIQEDASQQTHKLELLNQSSAELTTLQSTYLGLLDQSAAELTELQDNYKKRKDEVVMLKSNLQEVEENNKSLLTDIETLKFGSTQNLEKISLLEQTTTELDSLKRTSQVQSDELIALKGKLQESEESNKLLNAEIARLKSESSQKTQKLSLLEQTAADLDSLKATSQAQSDELDALKGKLQESEESNKLLNAEIDSLKAAYKEQSDEAVASKAKVAELDGLNKSLHSKIQKLEINANKHTKSLGLLDQTSKELTALKSAYKVSNDKVLSLKDKVINLDDSNKTLLSEVVTLKSKASQQTQKLGLLDQLTTELNALKRTYKARNDENTELKKQVVEVNKNKEELSDQLKKQITEIEELKNTNKKLNTDKSELMIKLNQLSALKSSLDFSANALTNLQNKLDDSENLSNVGRLTNRLVELKIR